METKEKGWLINQEAQGKLTAVLGTKGKLKISDVLFNKLPQYIRFRFDCDSRILYINRWNMTLKKNWSCL